MFDWPTASPAESAGGKLDRAWFSGRAAAARRDHPLHAIYATSFKRTAATFPLVWDGKVDYVYAVNVTGRYARRTQRDEQPPAPEASPSVDVEASLHAVAQMKAARPDLAGRTDLRPDAEGFAVAAQGRRIRSCGTGLEHLGERTG